MDSILANLDQLTLKELLSLHSRLPQLISRRSIMSSLSLEVIIQIMSYLSLNDYVRCLCVSKLWAAACDSADIWRLFARRYSFKGSDAEQSGRDSAKAWCKEAFEPYFNWHFRRKPRDSLIAQWPFPNGAKQIKSASDERGSAFAAFAQSSPKCTVFSVSKNFTLSLQFEADIGESTISCVDISTECLAIGCFDGSVHMFDLHSSQRIGKVSYVHVNSITVVSIMNYGVTVSGGVDGWLCAVAFTNSNSVLMCDRKNHSQEPIADIAVGKNSKGAIIVTCSKCLLLTVWQENRDSESGWPFVFVTSVNLSNSVEYFISGISTSVVLSTCGSFVFASCGYFLVEISLLPQICQIISSWRFPSYIESVINFKNPKARAMWNKSFLIRTQAGYEFAYVTDQWDVGRTQKILYSRELNLSKSVSLLCLMDDVNLFADYGDGKEKKQKLRYLLPKFARTALTSSVTPCPQSSLLLRSLYRVLALLLLHLKMSQCESLSWISFFQQNEDKRLETEKGDAAVGIASSLIGIDVNEPEEPFSATFLVPLIDMAQLRSNSKNETAHKDQPENESCAVRESLATKIEVSSNAANCESSTLDDFFTFALEQDFGEKAALAQKIAAGETPAEHLFNCDFNDILPGNAAAAAGLFPDSFLSTVFESNPRLPFCNNIESSDCRGDLCWDENDTKMYSLGRVCDLYPLPDDELFDGASASTHSPVLSVFKQHSTQLFSCHSQLSPIADDFDGLFDGDQNSNNKRQKMDYDTLDGNADQIACSLSSKAEERAYLEGFIAGSRAARAKPPPEQVPAVDLYRFASMPVPRQFRERRGQNRVRQQQPANLPLSEIEISPDMPVEFPPPVIESPTSVTASAVGPTSHQSEVLSSLNNTRPEINNSSSETLTAAETSDANMEEQRPARKRRFNKLGGKSNLRRDREILTTLEIDPVVLPPNEILNLRVRAPTREEYKCPWPLCGVTASRRYNLKIHYMTHVPIDQTIIDVQKYSCFVCGRIFRRRFDMQRHRFAKHLIESQVPDDGAGFTGKFAEDFGTKRGYKGP